MTDIQEYQVHMTVERRSGQMCCYILRMEESGQWIWLGDEEFGPFDTTLDVCSWLTRKLTLDLRRLLR
jgi:hypothetical protein